MRSARASVRLGNADLINRRLQGSKTLRIKDSKTRKKFVFLLVSYGECDDNACMALGVSVLEAFMSEVTGYERPLAVSQLA